MEQNKNGHIKVILAYQEDIRDIKLELKIKKCLKDLINGLNGFGEIHVIRTKPNFPPFPIVTASPPMSGIIHVSSVNPLKERKAVKVSEFNVQLSDDNGFCDIRDILTLQDMKHILIDRNNNKIKVYGDNYQLQHSMILQGQPCCACILPDYNMAVTIPYNKTIQVIGIADKLSKIRKIRTRLQCWGIAVMKNKLDIATYSDQHSILILDMAGREIRMVRPHMYPSEQLLYPWYVKVNENETVIYISYCNTNKLVAFNTSWNVLFKYTDQNLQYPHGIDTDREGNIYLSGGSAYNVNQISADGKLIKTLITKKEDTKTPQTIRFYRDVYRFIVTYLGCDVIEVYDMRD